MSTKKNVKVEMPEIPDTEILSSEEMLILEPVSEQNTESLSSEDIVTKNDISDDSEKKKNKQYGIIAIVFAVIIPIVGLIMGIIGVIKNKNKAEEEDNTWLLFLMAILISIVAGTIFYLIINGVSFLDIIMKRY